MLKQPVYIIYVTVALGYPVSCQYNGIKKVMECRNPLFFVEERVSGQGGGPEDGAGEATACL